MSTCVEGDCGWKYSEEGLPGWIGEHPIRYLMLVRFMKVASTEIPGVLLSSVKCRQLYIPAGFAHGFCVMSETATVLYKPARRSRRRAGSRTRRGRPRGPSPRHSTGGGRTGHGSRLASSGGPSSRSGPGKRTAVGCGRHAEDLAQQRLGALGDECLRQLPLAGTGGPATPPCPETGCRRGRAEGPARG